MLVYQVLRNEPPRSRAVNSPIPRDLEVICLKCLEKCTRIDALDGKRTCGTWRVSGGQANLGRMPVRTMSSWLGLVSAPPDATFLNRRLRHPLLDAAAALGRLGQLGPPPNG